VQANPGAVQATAYRETHAKRSLEAVPADASRHGVHGSLHRIHHTKWFYRKEKQMPFKKQPASVSVSEVREFTRGIAELLALGMSLDSILATAITSTSNRQLSNVLTEVRRDVLAGYPLSMAMAKYETVFDRNYVEMVRAGELTGSLDTRLARFLSPPDLSAAAMQNLL